MKTTHTAKQSKTKQKLSDTHHKIKRNLAVCRDRYVSYGRVSRRAAGSDADLSRTLTRTSGNRVIKGRRRGAIRRVSAPSTVFCCQTSSLLQANALSRNDECGTPIADNTLEGYIGNVEMSILLSRVPYISDQSAIVLVCLTSGNRVAAMTLSPAENCTYVMVFSSLSFT